MLFDLPEATRELREVALAFAAERLAPHALEWDETKHFPVEVMREAAGLGMAALYVREESGGAGLTRLAAATVGDGEDCQLLPDGTRLWQRRGGAADQGAARR